MIGRVLTRVLVWCFSALAIAAYVWLGIHRVPYPLELDCIEGPIMDHVARLAHGQPIYVAPTLHFIPFAYMPFFTFVASLLARAFGPAMWEPRLVSFVASLLLAALGALVVLAETRRPTLAIAAAGIYTMAFELTGACYDVARPDSLMLLLSFAGLATLRWTKGIPGALLAALLLSVGFFTKQHAVMFAFAACAYLLFHDRRRFLPFTLAIVAGCAGGYALLTGWLGPWFPVYTWSIPRGWSTIDRERIALYVGHGVFGSLAAMSVPSLLSLGIATRPARGGTALWYWVGLASFGTGLMATLDPFAYRHVLTPTVIGLAILGTIALDRIAQQLEAGTTGRAGLASAAVFAVAAVQFLPLLYPFHSQMPHRHAREADAEFAAMLKSFPDGVLLPGHGWYTTRAVGASSLHIIALDDILRSRGNAILRRDPQALFKLFAPLRSGPHRPVIVADVPLASQGPMWAFIAPGYRVADSLGVLRDVLRPITGNQYTPTYIYVPVEGTPPAPVGGTPRP